MAYIRAQIYSFLVQTDLAVLLMVSLLTALWVVLAIVDSHAQHANRRRQWFALLFAPFGALLRWKLALLNGKLSMSPWFPAGTLAANLLACCIDFGTQVSFCMSIITATLFGSAISSYYSAAKRHFTKGGIVLIQEETCKRLICCFAMKRHFGIKIFPQKDN